MVRRTETAIQVRFSDIDLAGHAHHGVYLSWFELARIAFLDQVIAPDNNWKEQGSILARSEVDHRSPVFLRDKVTITTWCDRIGKSSFDLRYALFAEREGKRELCAEGRSVLVCFEYLTRTTLPIPAAWRTLLEEHVATTD